MSPWLAFLTTLSLIILVHEWGHFIMARILKVRVERFSFGFGPRLLSRTKGETEYALSLLPFGGYVKLAGESEQTPGPARPWEYRSRSVAQRAAIVAAGPVINYLLAFILFCGVFLVGAPVYTTRIGRILPGYPAAESGLREGDRVLAVGNERVEAWDQMTRAIQLETEETLLTVERNGKQFQQKIKPKVSERENLFGRRIRIGMVGIAPSDEVQIRRYPLPQAMGKSAYQLWFLTRMTLQTLGSILTGGLSVRESLTGPIGIFYITSSVAEQGLVSLIHLIAVLSTSIGLFNLLPIPVLDGGHLAFLGVEGLRGRPVSLGTQEAMTRVGLGLLLLLLVVVTYNDFLRFDIGNRLRSLFSSPPQ